MVDHNIVILGGNFAGVGATHYILRHVFPALGSLNSTYQVILISPSERTFYKIAAPRAISEPKTELFFSINDAFAKYGSSHFQFIQGTATGLDTSAGEIDIMASGKALRKIRYDYLIIATGTTSQSPLWTLQSDHMLTKNTIDEVHHKLQKADSVIIAGGGAVGVFWKHAPPTASQIPAHRG
jgi:NADH dehydrogenase FAD-containing subunit